ncbi:MAG: Na-K-Cl cotransporter [bacterium]
MKKLGTFLGVFTPTILTILGVIMYLRLGWVVGNVGLTRTLVIVLLANSITLITTLSFSAIATNTRVGVGGAYYMISRSLGLEFGGAIGLPLFLSQACSVTLYAFGLAEALRVLWPGVPVQLAAFVIVGLVTAIAVRGAALALRAQLPLMGLIAVSLAALAWGAVRHAGGVPDTLVPPVAPSLATPPTPPGFWAVFAVFFPAVTGVMAGLGLSGDLKDPMRAIPRGAIAATLTGLAIYVLVPILLAKGASPEVLREEPLVWAAIAPLGPWLILPGLFGAIFSSAIGSILTAPRTIQALAVDRLAPRFLARARDGGEPLGGLIATLLIALTTVLLGDLNTVAPVVAMFFLTVYGMVNLVAALESLSGDPSWRPAIRVAWPISLAGALACFSVMFLINPVAAIVAIALEAILWVTLERQERRARWGDVRRGVYESLIRWSLERLQDHPMSARNWRPHVLVFAGHVEQRLDLVRFGTWFSQGRGVVTVCELLIGDLLTEDFRRRERQSKISAMLEREKIQAFAEVDVVREIVSGIVDVSQANGIAGLDSNTILLGWPDDPSRLVEFLAAVRRLERLNKSVVVGRIQPGLIPRKRERRSIHVWWGGLQRNSDLMILLAHLLTRNPEWRDARILVQSIASNEHMRAATEAYLNKLMPEIRIEADVDVRLRQEGVSIREAITQGSADADIVFLGLDPPEDESKHLDYVARLDELASPLKTVFFVKNATLFVGELVQESAADAVEQLKETQKAAAGEPSTAPES